MSALIERLPEPLVIVDDAFRDMVGDRFRVISTAEFLAAAESADPVAQFADPDAVAVVLFTSGTTSAPKAVELTHNNLTSYITATVELIPRNPVTRSHLRAALPHRRRRTGFTNTYAGRRMVHLPAFSARRVAGHRGR